MAKGDKEMTNEDIIKSLGGQLVSAAERIMDIAEGITAMREASPTVCENYEGFLLDEVAHVQILALDLTQAVTEGEPGNGDEAFGPGELTSEAGEKEDPEKAKE